MLFSKSFNYALRGVLYVALMSDRKKRIMIHEISAELSVPHHFLSKIMNKIAKRGILDSTKGPFGGLSINEKTETTTLLTILKTVDGIHPYNSCVLKMKKCNPAKPCILHERMSQFRDEIFEVLNNSTINDMVNGNRADLFQKLTLY